MISILMAGVAYAAVLTGCADGDTCTVALPDVPPFVQQQSLRFQGFDTPELHRPACPAEAALAEAAHQTTLAYMQGDAVLQTQGRRDRYGRLLVAAPELRRQLIAVGLARPYDGSKRRGWCS